MLWRAWTDSKPCCLLQPSCCQCPALGEPMYALLSDTQKDVLKKHVRNRIVHDFGSGSTIPLVGPLLESDAFSVICVDKDPLHPSVGELPSKVTYVRKAFENYNTPSIDVALLAWPRNDRLPGLLRLLKYARKIVYLGKNTDGCLCGNPELFQYFLKRALLDYVPERTNTMIALGHSTAWLSPPRQPKHEEMAGIDLANVHAFERSQKVVLS